MHVVTPSDHPLQPLGTLRPTHALPIPSGTSLQVALLRKLKHRHVVDYIGIGSVDRSSDQSTRSTMFLVSELMDGGTLKKLVMKQLVQPHKELYLHSDALRWAVHIGEALAYLHSAIPKVIHRDLKLENVLLCGSGTFTEAKLAVSGCGGPTRRFAGRAGWWCQMAGSDSGERDG